MSSSSSWSKRRRSSKNTRQQCIVPLLMGALRRSMGSSCREDEIETGWPTDVHHITHVTFDRFHGFLGLPLELQLEFPGRVPSASVSVFGVSTESMQCSYDSRGNSIPTILLLMQERLYSQGGLQAEGIFRINPENSEEEKVRGYLNRGIVPEEMDVHCLAGLIKAWFRELPCGVLDGLCPQQVLECKTDEEYIDLVNQLNPTESSLLNWAVDLMADVVEHENLNKMNSRNIAMVFAPNMTQMSDPLTALMHAVHVMNLLNTLINKTLTHRQQMGASGYSSDEDDEMMETQQEMETGTGEDECFLFSVQPQDLMQEESAMSITDDENDDDDYGESTSADSCFTSPYQENFTITPSMSSG